MKAGTGHALNARGLLKVHDNQSKVDMFAAL